MGCGDKEKMGDCSDNSQDENADDEKKIAKAKKDPSVKDDGKDSKSAKDDGKDDNKDEKFSLSKFADKEALEIKFGEDKDLISKLFEMSANELAVEFMKLAKENKDMKDKENQKKEAEKQKKLSFMLSEVKNKMDVDTFIKFAEEGRALSFEELDGEYANKLKAFCDKDDVDTLWKDGTLRFASSESYEDKENKGLWD